MCTHRTDLGRRLGRAEDIDVRLAPSVGSRPILTQNGSRHDRTGNDGRTFGEVGHLKGRFEGDTRLGLLENPTEGGEQGRTQETSGQHTLGLGCSWRFLLVATRTALLLLLGTAGIADVTGLLLGIGSRRHCSGRIGMEMSGTQAELVHIGGRGEGRYGLPRHVGNRREQGGRGVGIGIGIDDGIRCHLVFGLG